MKTRVNSTSSALAQTGSRSYWRVEDAELVLSAWRESGVSVSAFARHHEINVSRLLRWRRRLKESGRLEFHAVKLVSEPNGAGPATGGVELVLRNGRRVGVQRGFDAVLLEELVRSAESWPC